MSYIVRLNHNSEIELLAKNFSIGQQYNKLVQNPARLTLVLTKPIEEVLTLINSIGLDVTYIEIFTEERELIYESNYWNLIQNAFSTYNISQKAMVTELYLANEANIEENLI